MGFWNGSQIYWENGSCIQSNQTWVDVCIGPDHVVPFYVMICGVTLVAGCLIH